MIHLITGGARSGKSSFAEQQCLGKQLSSAELFTNKPIYIATAQAFDQEMSERISRHQLDRENNWQLAECPIELAKQVGNMQANNIYLIDCLTLWLNNILFLLGDNVSQAKIDTYTTSLLASLLTLAKRDDIDVVIVANEVGLGIVPLGQINRLFVDNAGWLNQAIAKMAEQVTFIVAGIPLQIKAINKSDNSD